MQGVCHNAKKEIASVVLRTRYEKIAFLSALIHTAGAIIISGGKLFLRLETESDFVKECVDKIIFEMYKDKSSISLGKITFTGEYLNKLLSDCSILLDSEEGRALVQGVDPALIVSDICAAAYIRGAFLGAGSLSLSSGYHLEFSLSNETLAKDLISLLQRFGFAAKATLRKEKHIVYIKSSDTLSDLLALMGAPLAVLEINERMAQRHVNSLSNRRLNCDMANIDKAVNTAQKQIETITRLKSSGAFNALDPKLTEAAEARLNYPDATLSEIASMLNISKSGLIHRLKRLEEFAYPLTKYEK